MKKNGLVSIVAIIMLLIIALAPTGNTVFAADTEADGEVEESLWTGYKMYFLSDSGGKYEAEILSDSGVGLRQIQEFPSEFVMNSREMKEWEGKISQNSLQGMKTKIAQRTATYDIGLVIQRTKLFANTPTNFLVSVTGKMSVQRFFELVEYHESKNEKVFRIYPDDTSSMETSTTTISEIMTTNASSYTTMTSSTTTSTTTTATTTSTTTTATTTSTTTTSATTTTSTSSYTTTTTLVISSDIKSELAEVNLRSVLEKISPTDTEIPILNDSSLYEYSDAIYLFKYNGSTYAYTILAGEKQQSNKSILVTPSVIEGLHIWKYDGNTAVVGLQDPLPDTTGRTFSYKDTEYEYELEEYSAINATDITSISKVLAGTKYMGMTGYMYTQQFDYNLSGSIDDEDLQIMLKYYAANIGNMQPLLIERYIWTYISNMERFGHENVVMKFSSEVVDYAFIVPCQEYINANKELMKSVSPVQIVPNSMYEELTKKYSVHGPEEYDFIIWDMYPLSGNLRWTTVSKSSEDWYFTGFYVQVLDDNGNLIKEWIGDIA